MLKVCRTLDIIDVFFFRIMHLQGLVLWSVITIVASQGTQTYYYKIINLTDHISL